jgi:hypothetical protein
MPHTQLSLREASAYLHLSETQVFRLAKQGEFEFRYNKDRPVFSKRELHDWATQKFLGEESG